ncbi:MAG: carboxylating nicotinate-nucleotide diphosphorylase [Cytophagales bacterium]
MEYLSELALNNFISLALAEDLGDGDHSAKGAIPENAQNTAQLIVKDEGILAGVNIAERIFHKVDPNIKFNLLIKDGKPVKYGDIAFTVEGSSRNILIGERLALNCMQRMSGIATYTKKLTNLIAGTNAKLLDTRKTTPNFRMMEKWAVVIGGGTNHRYGLFDMIILKDNHVDFSGGIKQAIFNTKEYLKNTGKEHLKIEVETRNLKEVQEVLEVGGVDRIMLDNMTTDMMKEAVQLINHKFETEASGGVTEATIRAIAETGVDYISVGALTHSIKSLDMSLKAINRLV